jgi:hypothetical protein
MSIFGHKVGPDTAPEPFPWLSFPSLVPPSTYPCAGARGNGQECPVVSIKTATLGVVSVVLPSSFRPVSSPSSFVPISLVVCHGAGGRGCWWYSLVVLVGWWLGVGVDWLVVVGCSIIAKSEFGHAQIQIGTQNLCKQQVQPWNSETL